MTPYKKRESAWVHKTMITYLEIIKTRPFLCNWKLADLYYEVHCPHGWQIALSFSLVAFSLASSSGEGLCFNSVTMFSGIIVRIKHGSSEISCSCGCHLVWFLELLESSAEYFPQLELFELDCLAIYSRRTWLVSSQSLCVSLAVALRLAGFKKSCLLHFNGKWKQDCFGCYT